MDLSLKYGRGKYKDLVSFLKNQWNKYNQENLLTAEVKAI